MKQIQIKNIVFDLGGVIVKDDFRIAASRLAKQLRIPARSIARAFQNADTTDFNRGVLSERVLWRRIGEALGIPYRKAHALRKVHWDIFTPIPGMFSLLKQARKKYSLYLLSNQTLRVSYIKKRYNYSKYFLKEIYSYKVKTVKPEAKIYRVLIQQTHIVPRQSIMIDNRLDNLKTARDFGFRTILFRNAKQLQRSIARLTEVKR